MKKSQGQKINKEKEQKDQKEGEKEGHRDEAIQTPSLPCKIQGERKGADRRLAEN